MKITRREAVIIFEWYKTFGPHIEMKHSLLARRIFSYAFQGTAEKHKLKRKHLIKVVK